MHGTARKDGWALTVRGSVSTDAARVGSGAGIVATDGSRQFVHFNESVDALKRVWRLPCPAPAAAV